MKIVDLPPTTIVGLEVRGSLRALWRALPRAWDELFSRAGELGEGHDPSYVDVSLEEVDGIYRQVVGREVEHPIRVPEGMVVLELPAKRCVHARHEGSVTRISETFEAMYFWALRQGIVVGDFRLDRGYRPGFHEKTHDLYMEIAA